MLVGGHDSGHQIKKDPKFLFGQQNEDLLSPAAESTFPVDNLFSAIDSRATLFACSNRKVLQMKNVLYSKQTHAKL